MKKMRTVGRLLKQGSPHVCEAFIPEPAIAEKEASLPEASLPVAALHVEVAHNDRKILT